MVKTFVIFVLLSLSYALQWDNETALQVDLLENYNTNVIPQDYKNPLIVNISLNVLRIQKFDELEGVLFTSGLFTLHWKDARLGWNIPTHGNVRRTIFKQRELWVPDINIGNTVKEFSPIGNPELNLLVTSDGRIEWRPAVNMETACEMDTTYFPFDHQKCTIIIVAWSHTPNMLNLIPQTLSVGESANQNSQWEVSATNWYVGAPPGKALSIKFQIYLKRRTEHYVITLLVPLCAMSVLNCVSVLVPRSSGETVSYSITVFLSYMVLMTFVTDSLPVNSTERPVTVTYIGIMLCLSTVTVLYAVLSMLISSRCDQTNIVNRKSQTDHLNKVAADLNKNGDIDYKNKLLNNNIADLKKNATDLNKNGVNIGNINYMLKKNEEKPQECRSSLQRVCRKLMKNVDFIMFALISFLTGSVTMWAVLVINRNIDL